MNYISFETPPFPVFIIAGDALYRPGDIHRKRSNLGVLDLIFVKNGELFMCENGMQYHLRENSFLILNPEGTHFGYKTVTVETHFYWIHFRFDGTYKYTNFIADKRPNDRKDILFYRLASDNVYLPVYAQLSPDKGAEMLTLLQSLISVRVDKFQMNTYEISSSEVSPLKNQDLFIRILMLLQISLLPNQVSSTLALNVMNFILENYNQPITVKGIAAIFNYHPVHIIRCVKHEFGITPNELLIQVRLDNAKKMLMSSNLPISEISDMVGFSSPNYFCRQFKQHSGVTPKKYRNQNTCQ